MVTGLAGYWCGEFVVAIADDGNACVCMWYGAYCDRWIAYCCGLYDVIG